MPQALYTPAKIWNKIDYMHADPAGRGLCERPEEWPWSSAGAYVAGPEQLRDVHTALLPIDFESLPDDPRPRR